MIVVGLTADLTGEAEGLQAHYQLKRAYVEAVRRAGALPWVLPYCDRPEERQALLARLDALVVTGGAFDVPPEAYGQTARQGLGPLKAGRTGFETQLLQAALEGGLPVLGVCGGMQLLNVVLGGTLHQDLLQEVPGAANHEQPHDRTQPDHPVTLVPGTRLAGLWGEGCEVNSTHHQAVDRVGQGLQVSARAPDGVVEAVELPGPPFVVGVQWHPELLVADHPAQQRIYDALVAAAGRR